MHIYLIFLLLSTVALLKNALRQGEGVQRERRAFYTDSTFCLVSVRWALAIFGCNNLRRLSTENACQFRPFALAMGPTECAVLYKHLFQSTLDF